MAKRRTLFEIEMEYNCGLIENNYVDTAMSVEEVKELLLSEYVVAYFNLKRRFVILLKNGRYFYVFNKKSLDW